MRALLGVWAGQPGSVADVDDLSVDIHRSDHPREVELAVLAECQHGVVEHSQLINIGFGPGAIQYRVRVGRLHRLYTGVYAVGHRTLRREGHWLAAVLACGPEAVLSHRSAAALWGLLPDAREVVDVTVPGRTRRGSDGIVVHNVRRLHPDDRVRRDNIPVTALPRTLLDLAEVARPRQLARAIDEAERQGLFDLGALDQMCDRSPGRHGLPALKEAIRLYRPTAPLTVSDLERIFVEICDGAGLPRPAMNLFVEGRQVDASWLDCRVIVEVDHYEFHRTRAAFEADRARDAALQRAGFRVLRVSDRRLEGGPAGVAQDIRRLLEAASPPARAGG